MKSTYELQQEQREARGRSRPVPKPVLRPFDATNLAGTETGREYLSHTRIAILQACHRKYELHYEKRLERLDRVESLDMGKAFQRAVELRRPEVGAQEILERVDEAGADEAKLKVQAAIVVAAAELYLRRWVPACGGCEGHGLAVGEDGIEKRDADGNLDPCDDCEGSGYEMHDETREMEYLVQLRNPWTGAYSRTFDLKGYADGVLELDPWREENATLQLIENKLVGRITNFQVRKLVLDRQVTLGAYGLWRATGKPVTKIHYRYVKKPQIKQRQNETVDQFCSRIIADYRERPDFYCYEETLFRTTEDMLRVECELWIWAEQLRNLRRQKIYDRNVSSCDDYGGCQFLPICTAEPDHQSLYRERVRA
jgi:hypothetical protein